AGHAHGRALKLNAEGFIHCTAYSPAPGAVGFEYGLVDIKKDEPFGLLQPVSLVEPLHRRLCRIYLSGFKPIRYDIVGPYSYLITAASFGQIQRAIGSIEELFSLIGVG